MLNKASKHSFYTSLIWLLLGSAVGLWLAAHYAFPSLINLLPINWRSFLEFGKLRQVHVNILAFAWLSLGLIGGLLYAIPHLSKTPLKYPRVALGGVYLWNLALIIGNFGLILGYTRGREYASMNWLSDLFLIAAFVLLLISVITTIIKREIEQMDVAIWYLLGSLIWMPTILILGKGLWKNFFNNPFSGYFDNVANWYLGHNILGLWFTTLGVGLSYFIIPRITHRPIYNHYLSLIGLWSLVLFYPAVGAHHTLDGPVPKWLMTEATICSVLMIIPVVTALWNIFKTTSPRWDLLFKDHALPFIVTGLALYLIVSLQGSFQALMFVSAYLHFSQWVPGHAMLALGGGFTFIAFGTIYFILPKIIKRSWYSTRMIHWHFWLSLIGIIGIFTSLTASGLIQAANWQNTIAGMHWIDAVVRAVSPEMVVLMITGAIFLLAQIIFMLNVVLTIIKGSNVVLEEREDVVSTTITASGSFKFEKSLPVLLIYMFLFYSFAVVTTYVIPYSAAKNISATKNSVQYTKLEEHGRKVYMREGCLWCHTQMVRHVDANAITIFRRGDIGNFTPPEWYKYQNPLLIGQHRRGPDLSHVWSRWPSEFWQREHLKNPQAFNPGTWMPPFSYLSDYDQQSVVAYLKTLR